MEQSTLNKSSSPNPSSDISKSDLNPESSPKQNDNDNDSVGSVEQDPFSIPIPVKKKPSLLIDTNDQSTLKKVKILVSDEDSPRSPKDSSLGPGGAIKVVKRVTKLSSPMENSKSNLESVNSTDLLPRLPSENASTLKRDGTPDLKIENYSPSSPITDFGFIDFSTGANVEELKSKAELDVDRLSISNISEINLKPEGHIEDAPKSSFNDDDAFDNQKPLDFAELPKKTQQKQKSQTPTDNKMVKFSPSTTSTAKRAVKKVDQGDKNILNKVVKSQSRDLSEIRQEPNIFDEFDQPQPQSDGSESSESINNSPSYNAKRYEKQLKQPKKPEIISSAQQIKERKEVSKPKDPQKPAKDPSRPREASKDQPRDKTSRENTKTRKPSKKGPLEHKLRSEDNRTVRSVQGVPYIGLVKEQKARALTIQNDRAEMDWWEIKYNRFKKNSKFAIENSKKSFGLWESTIRNIEGKFGTGVGSFFRLLRWLVLMNCITAGVYLIVYAPAISRNRTSVIGPSLYATFPTTLPYNNSSIDSGPVLLLLSVSYLIFSVIQMIKRLRNEFLKDNRMSTDKLFPFSTSVFTSWNFGTKGKEATSNQYYAIANLFRGLITNEEIEEKKRKYKHQHFLARRVTGVAISAMLLLFSGFLIQLSSSHDQTWITAVKNLRRLFGGSENDTSKDTPVLISFLNLVLPTLFELIARIMTFADPVTEQAFAIFLSFFAKMGGILVVLVTVDPSKKGNICKSLFDDYTAGSGVYKIPADGNKDESYFPDYYNMLSSETCWEYDLGYIMRLLLILELGITTVTTIGIALFKKFVFKRYQFDMNKNILELAYRQSIVWIGTAIAPGIIYLSIVGYFVIFWVKIVVLRSLGSPPRRIYNAHKQTMYFLISLMAAFFVVIIPYIVGFVMAPPGHCGPAFSPSPNDITMCKTLYSAASEKGGLYLPYLADTDTYCFVNISTTDPLYASKADYASAEIFKGECSKMSSNSKSLANTTWRYDYASNNSHFNNFRMTGYKSTLGDLPISRSASGYFNQTMLALEGGSDGSLGRWNQLYVKYMDMFKPSTFSTTRGSYNILPIYYNPSNSHNDGTNQHFIEFLLFILNPVVLLVIISCMGVWVYYLKSLAIKRNRRVHELLQDLVSERNEKKHLLKKIRKKVAKKDMDIANLLSDNQ